MHSSDVLERQTDENCPLEWQTKTVGVLLRISDSSCSGIFPVWKGVEKGRGGDGSS